MPAPGRNQPCPCGSGRKVKRCCGEQRGPAEAQLERAFIAQGPELKICHSWKQPSALISTKPVPMPPNGAPEPIGMVAGIAKGTASVCGPEAVLCVSVPVAVSRCTETE